MRVPRIYCLSPLVVGTSVELPEQASRHLVKVLRLTPGAPLVLFDGRGGEYAAELVTADRRSRVAVTRHEAVERESPLMTELAIGISRGERMDWVVQKATELGVTRISPLFSERTEVKLRGERQEKKQAHWQQIAASACEQCQRNRLPQIAAPRHLAEWLADVKADKKYVLHHRGTRALDSQQPPASVALLVGPEGGLSDAEIETAERSGFEPLTLGPRVLRTETAPLTALSLLQYRWGDLG